MLVAERMNRVSVLIMREDMEPVLEEIARSGVLHLTRIQEIDDWAGDLQDVGVSTLANEYAKRKRRIDDLILEISPKDLGRGPEAAEDIGLVDLRKVDKEVGRIEHDLEPLIASKRALNEKLTELRSLRSQVQALVPSGLPVAGLMRSSLLASAIGVIEEERLETLRKTLSPSPAVVLPYEQDGNKVHIVSVVLRRDKARLEEALRQVGFKGAAMPDDLSKVSAEIDGHVVDKIAGIEQDIEKARADISGASKQAMPVLQEMAQGVDAAILLLKIKEYCKLTEKTCLFSGWAPEDRTESLVSAIKEKTGGTAIIEVTEAEKLAKATAGKVEVPVLFKQPPFLKPFEMLVSGFGTPSYRTIDPTLFVAITFLVMFGMMFGDVGHGLVLLLAGILITRKSVKWREAGKLGMYCGAASMVFGFLYGSFFGLEELLPTLWMKPLENITDLFKAAIGFGIVMVSLGIILNVVNSLRTHSFWEHFFDKSGPLVGVVYWAGIGIVIRFMISGGGAVNPVLFYGFFILPLIILIFRGPLLRLMGRRRRVCPDGVGTYAMESVVEILEILMGYLANTVSFIRVAAFGLAHAGLFIAVFSLARVVSQSPGGVVLSWLVLVLGNAVIILLEGLVVTIQALRLEYYEFFGKFFRGLGSKYEPAGPARAHVERNRAKGGE
jgi:V/A-type H+-transporting ATPase subunit I